MSADSTAAQPFGISAGGRVTVYGAQARPEVAAFLPEQVLLAQPGSTVPADVVLLFAGTADLAHDLAGAAAAVDAGGVLWVCYPAAAEGSERDLNLDTVATLLASNEWQPLSDAVLDEQWSAVCGQPAGK